MRPVLLLCSVLAATAAGFLALTSSRTPDGALTVVFGDEPRSLDPALASLTLEGRILAALFEGLTVPDPATLEPRPGVALSWDRSGDGLTWTFRLRGDAAWSDGRPVTAEDFRWSWIRVLRTPDAVNWELLACIRGARDFRAGRAGEDRLGIAAPDPLTLVVTLESPTDWFLSLTGTMTYLPVPRAAVEAHGRTWMRPGKFVGNGPFVIDAWEPNHRIVALRNPRYHGAARVALPALVFLAVPPGPTQYNLYAGGLADWIADPPPDLVRDLRGSPDLHVSPRLGISFVRLAVRKGPFADPAVRRAFALSVDRERVVRTNGAGQIPWAAFVPPGLAGYSPPARPLRDLPRARELLAGAGFPQGRGFPPVRFLYPAQKEFVVVAQTLQAVWKEALGVTVVMDRVDRKEWSRRMRELDYDLAISSWIGDYQDPNTFLEIFTAESGNNRTGWADPAYDGLVRMAAGETGEARLRTLAEAELRLVEEGPVVPLYVPVTIELWRPSLRGVHENLIGIHPLQGVSRGEGR
ncbi:MAG: peptide ABC transporter substrate-binding protein [Candidatus Brocadiae bacterium]|nr:peptide ABC transporter substrate-binding protein [Candidatus Brocadiia bacterium]